MVLLSLIGGSAGAQAWTPDLAEGYAQIATGGYGSDAGWDRTGRIVPRDRFRSTHVSVYADVGLGHRLALRGSVPGTVAHTEIRPPAFALGNAVVGLRRGLATSIAVEWITSVPLVDGTRLPLHTDRVWSTGPALHGGGGLTTGTVGHWVQGTAELRIPLTYGPGPTRGRIAWTVAGGGGWGAWWLPVVGHQLRVQGSHGLRATLAEGLRDVGFVGLGTTPPAATSLELELAALGRPSAASPWMFQIAGRIPMVGRDAARGYALDLRVGRSWTRPASPNE